MSDLSDPGKDEQDAHSDYLSDEFTNFKESKEPEASNPNFDGILPENPIENDVVPEGQEWKMRELDKKINLEMLHDHPLERVEDKPLGELEEWCCNGIELFEDGCKSGQTDLSLHAGTKAYRSTGGESADFDLCEVCIRWVIHCYENDEDLGLDESSIPN